MWCQWRLGPGLLPGTSGLLHEFCALIFLFKKIKPQIPVFLLNVISSHRVLGHLTRWRKLNINGKEGTIGVIAPGKYMRLFSSKTASWEHNCCTCSGTKPQTWVLCLYNTPPKGFINMSTDFLKFTLVDEFVAQ